MGEVLDDAVAYHYVGVPPVTPADFMDHFDAVYRSFERPRFATFRFSPYARTPVHDLPHNGVGVLALHNDEWREMLGKMKDSLPSDIDIEILYGVAVEKW